jgi:hypothetical protein
MRDSQNAKIFWEIADKSCSQPIVGDGLILWVSMYVRPDFFGDSRLNQL